MSNQQAITVDQAQVDSVIRMLSGIQRDANLAIVRSLNKTVSGAKTATAKGIGKTVTLKAKVIKKNMRISKASALRLSAKLHLKRVLTPAILFTNRKLKKGVSLKVYKNKGAVRLSHYFYAQMSSGRRGIFSRREISNGFYAKRLPIDEFFGPSITTVYEKTPGLSRQVEFESADRLQRELDSQINFILNRYNDG